MELRDRASVDRGHRRPRARDRARRSPPRRTARPQLAQGRRSWPSSPRRCPGPATGRRLPTSPKPGAALELARGGGRDRRPRRQRGAAGVGQARRLLGRADPARLAGQPRGADPDDPRAARRLAGARLGALRLHLVAERQGRDGARARSIRRPSSGCAGSPSACARTCAARARRLVGRDAGARSARRGCSPTPGRRCRGASGPATPEEVAGGVVSAIERDRAEVEVAPRLQRFMANFAARRPDLAGRIAARAGVRKIADAVADSQTEKR